MVGHFENLNAVILVVQVDDVVQFPGLGADFLQRVFIRTRAFPFALVVFADGAGLADGAGAHLGLVVHADSVVNQEGAAAPKFASGYAVRVLLSGNGVGNHVQLVRSLFGGKPLDVFGKLNREPLLGPFLCALFEPISHTGHAVLLLLCTFGSKTFSHNRFFVFCVIVVVIRRRRRHSLPNLIYRRSL